MALPHPRTSPSYNSIMIRYNTPMKIYDVCIIGSGAGGAPIAYELAQAGFDVVVLEKGKWFKEEDFSKDELGVCRREIYSPRLQDEYHIINVKENGKWVRYDGRAYEWSFWNGCIVGGASNFMSGYFHRLKPNDFKLKTVYGEIEGADIADWPISYEELEPYYDKVERIIGVSGKVKHHTFLEPRSTPDFPLPPLKENELTKRFDAACETLGFEYIQTPRAILSKPQGERSDCYYSNFCGSYPCSSGAKGSARAVLLQNAAIEVKTQAFVYRLESDKTKVHTAYYYDATNQTQKVHAKIFVVAATPIETSRLLLNSTNKHFPKGLANNNNQVGRNLIFSAGGSGSGVFYQDDLPSDEWEALIKPGVFFNRSIQHWYEYAVHGKRYKGGTIDFLFQHANIIPRVKEQIWDEEGNILWGRALQEKLQNTIPKQRKLNFEVFNDWLPRKSGRVSIDRSAKDKWGIPVAALYLDPHPHDLEVGAFLAAKAKTVLQQMGAKDIQSDISAAPPPNLVAGGCRFGEDPHTSVLDKACRAWELENLYVSDASFMPTGGSVPYTFSIYANSFRIADILKGRLS